MSAWRVIEYTPGESCLRHSSSVLTTFGTSTAFSFCPESEKSTMVTFSAAPLAALASRDQGLRHDHKSTAPSADAELARNIRRRETLASSL